MAVSDGEQLTVVKDQGLVANVFDDRTLAGLIGHLAIGTPATRPPARRPGATPSPPTGRSASASSRSATTAT